MSQISVEFQITLVQLKNNFYKERGAAPAPLSIVPSPTTSPQTGLFEDRSEFSSDTRH